MKRHGLSLVLGAMFLLAFAFQSIAGWRHYNEEQAQHRSPAVVYLEYLATPHFWEATSENWESEFLQMAVFVLLTTVLYQQGSAESKRPNVLEPVDVDPREFRDRPDVPGPVKRGGWRLRLYEHSLGLTLIALFLLSMGVHAVSGWREYNDAQTQHREPAISLGEYVTSARFWFESMQNWQSEFLSILAMVVLSIWLRQRHSPESKPVDAPHSETGAG